MKPQRRAMGSASNPRGPRSGPLRGERAGHAPDKSPSNIVRHIGSEAIFNTSEEVINRIELRVISQAAIEGCLDEAMAALDDGYRQELDDAIDLGILLKALDAYRDGFLKSYIAIERDAIE